jgi:uncharacterized protein YtpQ (UPF0354 family)
MRGRLAKCLLLAGCLLIAAPAVGQSIPTDESGFTKYVAKRLRKELPGERVRMQGPLTLSIAKTRANLDRIFSFCQRDAAGCAAEIETYVKGIAESRSGLGAEPPKESIRIIVRSADYVQQVRRVQGESAATQSRTLVEGLFAIPVFDLPRTTRLVHAGDYARLGLTSDQVYELGLANLRKVLKPLPAKPAGRGQIGELASDYFQPSRLVLLDSWRPLAEAQNGVLIVAVPATDKVIYMGDDSEEAIALLRRLVRAVASQSPKPLSQTLLRWTPSGWEIVR